VYGGSPNKGKLCGYCDDKLVGDSFMGGAFYFMSTDLARFIVSLPEAQRKNITVSGHEDITIGNMVYSNPQQVTPVVVGDFRSHSITSHPIKNPFNMQRNFLARMKANK
jgi:hypothetical protein